MSRFSPGFRILSPDRLPLSAVPVGVVIYVLVGGMRASLLADYIRESADPLSFRISLMLALMLALSPSDTAFLFAIIITFMMVVYTTSEKIGSPGAMYDMLVLASERAPVEGNAGGSYLTMRSKSGLIFGIINIVCVAASLSRLADSVR